MRAYLEACHFVGKHAEDKRRPMCISSIEIVEGVLCEKGMMDKLREANKVHIPWRPPAPAAAPTPPAPAAEEPSKTTAGYEPPAPPAPAPAPAPAPVAAPAAAPSAKEASEEIITTSAGTDFNEVAPDVPRVLTVTLSSHLTPTFDFGDGGTMVMELSHIMVNISTTCEPAWPSNAPAFPPSQDFRIPTDDLKEIVFDPSKPEDMPGGTVQTVVVGQGEICSNVPDWLTVQVQRQTMAPWGSHKLLEGTNETELQYEVEVESTVSMAEGPTDDSSALGIGLSVKFTGWLTGHKSAVFQPDGKPKVAPVRS